MSRKSNSVNLLQKLCMHFVVLRSQTRLIQQSPVALRNCWVSIEPNFQAIAMQWLARSTSGKQNADGPSQLSQSQVATSSLISDATDATALALQNERRFSVASCRNVFEIDGLVQETGFDFLNHVSPADDGENQPHDEPSNRSDTHNESGEYSFSDIGGTLSTPEVEVFQLTSLTFQMINTISCKWIT